MLWSKVVVAILVTYLRIPAHIRKRSTGTTMTSTANVAATVTINVARIYELQNLCPLGPTVLGCSESKTLRQEDTMLLELMQTCSACPEAYDVMYKGEEVGDMRLRHGYFRVRFRGGTVYSAEPRGDGIFEYDEREYYLNQGKLAIFQCLLDRGEIKV